MINSYFTFLYNECKRSSTRAVDISQIKAFINSPEGQKGYEAFCVMRGDKQQQKPIKSFKDALNGIVL